MKLGHGQPTAVPGPLLSPLMPPREVVHALGAWDVEVFRRIAVREAPVLDVVLPALSRAADFSLLWVGCSAALWATKRRRARKAARRGLASIAVASALTNQVGKRVLPRARPVLDQVPLARRAVRVPTSGSLPSGHAASAAAFAVSVGLVQPRLGVPLAALASAVAYSRVYTGVHYPSDVLLGAAVGAVVAVGCSRVAPVRTPSPLREIEPYADPQPPRPQGQGVVAVVNPVAGGGRAAGLADEVAHQLPLARIKELSPGEDLGEALRQAATDAEVLGVVGGDGSVNMAAQVAKDAGLPLLVVPGGTFNHFATDLLVGSAGDATAAVEAGSAIRVDLGTITEAETGESRVFLNTASLGSYPSFVTARNSWESRFPRPVAAAAAIWTVLRSERPLRAVINGRDVAVAMMFIGNGRYQPHGFAPSWRPRLDDGLLDVRLVDRNRRLAALRLVASLATGRLGRSHLYTETASAGLQISLPDGSTDLAYDGETTPGFQTMRVGVSRGAVTVYRPPSQAGL
jgi:diacylglycerol kinase family enzyme/membrane-associated phospholipid phosphatase